MLDKNNFDMTTIVANAEKIKAKKATKVKKPSVSLKPLQFEESDEDSPLKAEIIKIINSRNLIYADIYSYCTEIKDGDIAEGQKLGYNIIYGLTHRHSMIDSTFSLLCDFLDLDVMLVPRNQIEMPTVDEDETNEENKAE